jgi:hypothetical protein
MPDSRCWLRKIKSVVGIRVILFFFIMRTGLQRESDWVRRLRRQKGNKTRTCLSRETTLLHIAELAAHLHVLGLGPTSLLAGGLGRPGEGIALLPIRACVHGSGGAESGIVVGDKGAGGL